MQLWREKEAPDVRIGVFHVGNELIRKNFPWYAEVDFVLRNYWLPDGRFPPNVGYIPLGFQMPSICAPESPIISEFTTCTCGGQHLPHASARSYLYSFSGSLRRGREEMLLAFNQSSLAQKGKIQVASALGGDGENPKAQHIATIVDSVFVLAPCGNVMEKHRIYEALALGAIPLIERCVDKEIGANIDGFVPFQDLILDSYKDMLSFITRYANNRVRQDQLQQRVLEWWTNYSTQIGQNATFVALTNVPQSVRWAP